jgi:hypothetical protein
MDKPPPAATPKPCCVCGASNGKHCAKCKSRHYCGKKCQLVDWNEGGHKAQCRQLAAALQDRLLDGSTAAARLPAVPTGKTVVKATAQGGETPDWRGTCAICLDLLPVEFDRQCFYACCCKRICKECSLKWLQHDTRCPLCRAPAPTSTEYLRRLQKHVDKGNAEAQFVLGNTYSHGAIGLRQNFKRAFQVYELAAAQGHVLGQNKVGHCLEVGDGVKIDYKAAAHWYRRAAERGYPGAQFNLGRLFLIGKGVARSDAEAVRWFRPAAAQGFGEALHNLGACLSNGTGVPQDNVEALRLFKRAAALGVPEAAEEVARVEAYLSLARANRDDRLPSRSGPST